MIKTVKLGVVEYRVEEIRDLHDLKEDGVKRFLWGLISESTQTIWLKKESRADRKRVTIVHEIMHGILNNANLTDQDENQIAILAFGIVTMLRDNPKLVKLLLE